MGTGDLDGTILGNEVFKIKHVINRHQGGTRLIHALEESPW